MIKCEYCRKKHKNQFHLAYCCSKKRIRDILNRQHENNLKSINYETWD